MGDRRRNCTYLAADTSLGWSDIEEYGVFCCSGAITLTLESPSIDYVGLDFDVVSDSASTVLVACTNGFPNALDSGAITTGQAARVACTMDAAGGFTWYIVGGTASSA